jgi:hypothetical protein
MLIQQLSVFVENRHGVLATLTDALVRYGIDIRAIAVFDTTEFGIVRLIVDDPEKALQNLKADGFVAKLSEVIAVEPEDKPGSLNELFHIMGDNGLNIEYIYSFVMRKREMPYVVFKVDDQEKALDVLKSKGLNTRIDL